MTKYARLNAQATYALPAEFAGKKIPVLFVYGSDDPLVITARFGVKDDSTVWLLGRDLLWDGLKRNVADTGLLPSTDVMSWVSGTGEYCIFLDSPFGTAMFKFDTAMIRQYLAYTYQLVPPGKEYTDEALDNAISEFFSKEI